jgi:hypothetical protein
MADREHKMRSLPGILLTALTVVAITVSAFLTASHFGMRDWPTPPMPDTASRLITPTEAGERLSYGEDPIEAKVAGEAGEDARRSERRTRGNGARRTDRVRRGSSRHGDRSGRRSTDRNSANRNAGSRNSDGRNSEPSAPAEDEASTPATDQPTAPQPAPATPVTEASSGEQSQARPGTTVTPPAVPAPSLDPVVPDPPTGGDDGASSTDGGQGERPGRGRGRGAVRNLLGALL